MRNRRLLTSAAAAAAAVTVLGLGATQAAAAPAVPAAPQAQQQRPLDGPPGTVWTGKKFWTLSGCQAAGTDLVASGKWADPFCDGTGLRYDLWARPL